MTAILRLLSAAAWREFGVNILSNLTLDLEI
jgi:hypothetical protein